MFRKFKTLTTANLQVAMIYRFNFFVGIASTLIMCFAHFKLWEVIFKVNNTSVINGYTFPQMIMYILSARILYIFTSSLNIEGKISGDIKVGALSIYLIKPMNYLVYNVASKLGDVIVQTYISITAFILLFVFVRDLMPISKPSTIIFVIFSAICGMIINMLIGYNFALTAFWLEQIDIIFVLKEYLLSFLSGVWIPISFFPNPFIKILEFLPFNYMIAFSIDIFLGNKTGILIYQGMLVQLLWILLLSLSSSFLWQRGIKKYKSVGG